MIKADRQRAEQKKDATLKHQLDWTWTRTSDCNRILLQYCFTYLQLSPQNWSKLLLAWSVLIIWGMGFYRTLLKALLIDSNYNVGIISGQLSDCQNYTEYVSREKMITPSNVQKISWFVFSITSWLHFLCVCNQLWYDTWLKSLEFCLQIWIRFSQ